MARPFNIMALKVEAICLPVCSVMLSDFARTIGALALAVQRAKSPRVKLHSSVRYRHAGKETGFI